MRDLFSTSGCLLCDELSGDRPLSSLLALYASERDKILLDSERFILLRDISPLVPGHSLLIPKKHYSNFGQLSRMERDELRRFKADCIDLMTRCFASPVLFEHGARVGEVSAGACIAHAHIHFIPTEAPVADWIREVGETTRHASVFPSRALSECSGGDYLACEDNSGHGYLLRRITAPLPCQFVRRHLARLLNLQHWNWEFALRDLALDDPAQ